MTHTPGPWRAGEDGGSVVADQPVEGFRPLYPDDAFEFYCGYLIAESVAPENRPLIIAAPDMLTACQMTVDYFTIPVGEFQAKYGPAGYPDVLSALREAIGKATGGGAP